MLFSFFFFKQKTAYELRISDWSSDVCSSDLPIEVVAADDVSDDQDADEEAQSSAGRDRQRHARAVARLDGVVPIADQEEGKEARQFPEKHELDQVAREHDAKPGTHESKQEREEPRTGVLGRHVVAAINHHQEAAGCHQNGQEK